MTVLKKIIDHKIIGILRGYGTTQTVEIVKLLTKNEFNVIEVALNSPESKETLKVLKEEFGEDIVLGAGTVLTIEDAEYCLEIGVDFLLSPIYSEEILQFSIKNDILYIPGCYTPTEIYNAYAYGAKMVKVFPAGGLKAEYIKDILAPINELTLLPTGGVTPENIKDFLRAGSKAVGVSSALVPNMEKIDHSLEEEIEKRVKNFKKKISEL